MCEIRERERDDDVVVIMKHSIIFVVLKLLELRDRECVRDQIKGDDDDDVVIYIALYHIYCSQKMLEVRDGSRIDPKRRFRAKTSKISLPVAIFQFFFHKIH